MERGFTNKGEEGPAPIGHHLQVVTRRLKDLKDREQVKVELNLEKWAAFLFPAGRKRPKKARSKEWTALDPATGKEVQAKLTVHVVDGESLAAPDHRTLLALEKLFWDKKRDAATGYTTVTYRAVARAMRLSWGTKTRRDLKASLSRLGLVPLTQAFAFYDWQAGQFAKRTAKPNPILELESLEKGRLTKDGTEIADPQRSKIAYRFHPLFERNLLSRGVKPLLYNVAMGIRGEIAFTLYTFLDLVMAKKTVKEWRLRKLLCDELGVAGKYQRPADLRRLALRAIKKLEGLPISTGTLSFEILKTKDGSEDKLRVVKSALPKPRLSGTPASARSPLSQSQKQLVDELVDTHHDPHSRRYYEKLLRELGESRVRGLFAETSEAARRGGIEKTRAKYFTDLAERALGNKPSGGERSPKAI